MTKKTAQPQTIETTHEAESRRKMEMICAAADELKAHDIVVLDVRRHTPLADYFVICSGTSATHIQSIADNVQDKLREGAKVRTRPQGEAGSFWIILDYGDVILHIFDAPTREFYDLERLWADADVMKWSGEQPDEQ